MKLITSIISHVSDQVC